MTQRIVTLLACIALAAAVGVIGAVVTIPYVALGPGPTFNTLGTVDGKKVVQIEGERTYPAPGHLNLTTVSVINGVTLWGALEYWVSGQRALVPRNQIFAPGLTREQIKEQSQRRFDRSTSAATLAALRYLGYPTTVVVRRVEPKAPAQGELSRQDEIVAVEGRPVDSAGQLVERLSDSHPGDVVTLRIDPGKAPVRQVDVTLGPGPEQHGYLGVIVGTEPAVDFDIDVTLTEVGGPSAGLMFALGIVDKLTPESLTDGEFIAGTGTITPTGEVGRIGGIQHKMTSAYDAGAEVFLVPAKNCDEAVPGAPEGLQLVKVTTLADAIHDLEGLRAGGRPVGCR